MRKINKILHITEALGGGVLNLVSQLACAQMADGLEVVLAYSLRPDTPSEEQLAILFPAPITKIKLPMVTPVSPLRDLLGILSILKLLLTIRPDIIHLHSSKAGVLGRLAAFFIGSSDRVFYSPHGLSFLKQDVSANKQKMYLWIERVMSCLGGVFIASSKTEADLACHKVGHTKVVLVENSINFDSVKPFDGVPRERVRVVTSGRVCYPKAPWRFKELATEFQNELVEFIWIGDGELRHDLDGKNHPENLTVLGWCSREDVFGELSRSDVFVLLSLWEGMPLALIEAQAAGLPAVVSDVVGCRDVVVDGETGFVCVDMEDVVNKVRQLIRSVELRRSMGAKAANVAKARFTTDRMHKEILAVYKSK